MGLTAHFIVFIPLLSRPSNCGKDKVKLLRPMEDEGRLPHSGREKDNKKALR